MTSEAEAVVSQEVPSDCLILGHGVLIAGDEIVPGRLIRRECAFVGGDGHGDSGRGDIGVAECGLEEVLVGWVGLYSVFHVLGDVGGVEEGCGVLEFGADVGPGASFVGHFDGGEDGADGLGFKAAAVLDDGGQTVFGVDEFGGGASVPEVVVREHGHEVGLRGATSDLGLEPERGIVYRVALGVEVGNTG